MANRVSGDKDVVKTIYGKHSDYEIVRSKILLKTDYHIYKNCNYYRGSFSGISQVVEAANKES